MESNFSITENELWKLSKPFRYQSISNKQILAFYLSFQWAHLGGNVNCIGEHPMLWEIASVVTMMIYAKNGNNVMSLIKFKKLLPSIANQVKFIEEKYTISQLKLNPVDALYGLITSQIDHINPNIYYLHRYDFFFNHPGIKEGFESTFNCTPDQILTLGFVHSVLVESLKLTHINESVIRKYIEIMNVLDSKKHFSTFIDNFLTIDQNEHNKLIMKNYGNTEEIIRSQKYISTYPFIRFDDQRYLLAPQYMFEACTKSLLRQLLTNNTALLTKMGNVLERYLFNIANNGNYINGETLVGDNVTYSFLENSNLNGEDLVLFEDGNAILISSKHHLIQYKYRVHDIKAWSSIEKKYAEAVEQSFKYFSHFKHFYKPFPKGIMDRCQKVYSLVIIDSNVSLNQKRIVEIAKESVIRKKNRDTSIQFDNFILNHFRFIRLDTIEYLFINSHKLLDYIKENPFPKFNTYDVHIEKFPRHIDNTFIQTTLSKYSRDKLSTLINVT